jgi:hypothetical protein
MARVKVKTIKYKEKEVPYEPSIPKNIIDWFGFGFYFPRLFCRTATTLPRSSPPLLSPSVRVSLETVTDTRSAIDHLSWWRDW